MAIHSTAIIHKNADIAPTAVIGPYCIIGPHVVIKDRVTLQSHVCIEGHTTIDEGTEIFPFASLGQVPQDLKYKGEEASVYVGKNTVIREYVTIHIGTAGGIMKTVVGNNCLLMIGVHVAHDCMVGNNVVLANNATLAGHVTIGDFAILGGLSAVHQFVKIGQYSIIGGGSIVIEDVIPYGNVSGERANLTGLNIVGMKRRGLERQVIRELQSSFDMIFLEHEEDTTFEKKVENVAAMYKENDRVMEMVEFLKSDHARPICMPKVLKNR
ncbi:acyl-ACP--UDP-N-acetylglucosamine O-acyltransferase [Rickettsiales endosymbiont of Peranema trichophorum]|uniref:acyl-ACP--UDP-N-acetylglucosamine O-acyltransferase n=1 Tax=Rickettsiales endosymbiont of Peranema trichophorum TaxID=2486577 RepID=UPI001023C247|nr:acyl-ACP--UDP-N-acetylglucosamine O-acyltransferase [Rickettsiales endosymbiont of Peranema trichophorum]RZI47190.1 acyl-ACP--UDP-N-acetylglucosamine O-acyltransferase [Rickettsiales endosymbiont of Peranema trichophorum]